MLPHHPTTTHISQDTPPQLDPTYGSCSENRGKSSCPGSLDAITNFMDYADDACMSRFTAEQVVNMHRNARLYRPTVRNPPGARRRRAALLFVFCSCWPQHEGCFICCQRLTAARFRHRHPPPPAAAAAGPRCLPSPRGGSRKRCTRTRCRAPPPGDERGRCASASYFAAAACNGGGARWSAAAPGSSSSVAASSSLPAAALRLGSSPQLLTSSAEGRWCWRARREK